LKKIHSGLCYILLGASLDKVNGVLDPRFLIGYWFPVFIASIIAIMIRVYVYGWEAALIWWQQDWMLKSNGSGFYAQIWFIVVALITITTLAYLLKPFTHQIIRFYEGYWPLTLQKWFTEWPVLGEKSIWKNKTNQMLNAVKDEDWEKYNRLQSQLFYGFPTSKNLIMPTSLGNTIRAAEDYSNTSYGMDSIFWWPRLWPLLPRIMIKEIDDSFYLLVALLNLSALIAIVAIFGLEYLRQAGFGWEAWLELLLGLILAFISYRSAVVQAQEYGENIRVSIDLYRFEILKALHQSLPNNLKEEFDLWDRLKIWLYDKTPKSVAGMKYKH
jgi:hypothetical protein